MKKMGLQDVVSDLEDKISTLSKNEMFVSSRQSIFNSKLLPYEKAGKDRI